MGEKMKFKDSWFNYDNSFRYSHLEIDYRWWQ